MYYEGEKLNQDNINLLENVFEYTLPREYKDFLLAHNGGCSKKNVYNFLEVKNSSNIAYFFAFYGIHVDFYSEIYDDLLKEYYRHKDNIPEDFIPIGTDSGGNYICLGINDMYYDKVYFWDHEEQPDEGCIPNMSNMYLIGNSFVNFINSLYKSDLYSSNNLEEIWVYTHDKYSIVFSTEAKKYGSIITDFFAKAPDEVEDYIIEQKEGDENVLLYYDSNGKRYNRLIKNSNEVTDYVTDIEKKNEKS